MNTHVNNKQIAKNTFALYMRMGITMLVSLYTSRIVLNTLGVEDFGIYNLVGGVVVLFSFISNALNGAIQRFLTFALGKKDLTEFNTVFNNSLTAIFSISIVLILLLETIGIWFLNNKLVIQDSRIFAANVVFQLSILSFFISINSTPYNSAIIAFEKMSVYAYVGIIDTVLKLIAVIILQFSPYDNLISYSFLILIVGLISQSFNLYYCSKYFQLKILNFSFDKVVLKKLFSFSGWTLFGGFSNVLSSQGINILFNLFYGVVVNAAYGVSTQISNAVFQFVSGFQTAFSPQITKLYAQNDTGNLNLLIYRSAKISFFLLLIIFFPIVLNVNNILTLWLKVIPNYSSEFTLIILSDFLINTISGPLWMLINATGDVKKYQVYISFVSLISFLLVYVLLKIGFTPEYALLSKIIATILLFVLRLVLLREKANLDIRMLLIHVVKPLLIVSLFILIFGYLINLLNFNGMIESVILKTIMSFLISIPIIYLVGLNIGEKIYIQKIFIEKLKFTKH